MMASPMRQDVRVVGAARRSCSIRCSASDVSLRPEVLERQLVALLHETGRALVAVVAKIAEREVEGQVVGPLAVHRVVSSDGRLGGPPGSGAASRGGPVCRGGSRGLRVLGVRPPASLRGADSPRAPCCTTCSSSRVESWRSWIACCSSGVMTTRWLIRWTSFIERELLAQVDLPGLRVVGQLGRGAGGEDPAVVEDVGAVGDGEGLPHVVVGDQHADAALLQPGHDLLDVADRDGIDAGERLVEQQVAGIGDEGPRDLEPPPLASGQGDRPCGAPGGSGRARRAAPRAASCRSWCERSRVSRIASRFSSTVSLRNTEDSCGR